MEQKERLNKIRAALLKLRKATWTQLAKETSIQSKELSYDLKELLGKREVTAEKDTKDRRITWYMLKDKDRALAESKRFESIEFISNLGPDVNFAEAESRDHDFHARCSVFVNDKNLSKEDLHATAQEMAHSLLTGLKQQITMQKLKIKPSFRNAYVLTLEKR